MITSNIDGELQQAKPDYPDEIQIPTDGKGGVIKIRKSVILPDYDSVINETFNYIDTNIVNINAKIFEGRGKSRRLNHYRSLREFATSPTFKNRIRESVKISELKELNERMHLLADADITEAKRATRRMIQEAAGNSFDLGLYSDEVLATGNRAAFPLQDVVLPSMSGPQSKQQLFVDYLDMHRKGFEAATRNPLGKRICKLVPQFVLGRSLLVTLHEEPEYQEEWDTYWKHNKMKIRVKQIFRELLIYGEIFLRYFRLPPESPAGLAVRSLDPSTIWDIVTNLDDIEDVLYYHQQYVITNNSPVAFFRQQSPPSTLVIRQIAAAEIDHYKINSTSSEKRGRSELFAILGYLQRFRQFVDDRILLNKIRSMFAVDVAVDGHQTEVTNAEAQFATPPGTGSVFVHNKAVSVDFKTANTSDHAGASSDAELFLKIIAVGAGVSQSFLGVQQDTSRTGALIETEPDVKNFEDYQEMVQSILEDAVDRVVLDAQVRRKKSPPKKDMVVAVTFPSIAQEDRSAKLKDLGLSESMGWFSKRRAANIAADEFKQDDYDYDDEQKAIKTEMEGDPVIAQAMVQAPKGPIEPKRGAGGPEAGAKLDKLGGGKDVLKQPGAQTGSVVKSDAVRALPEKNKKLRASAQIGWASTARSASIAARKRKAETRRSMEAARHDTQKS